MIIEFCVTNFRSIRDEQVFSLYTRAPGKHLPENTVLCPGTNNIHVLKSAGVYGANASGKSNLLRALQALSYLVSRSNLFDDKDEIAFSEPYRLDGKSAECSTVFEIEFVTRQQNRFHYQVAFKKEAIQSERLSYYPSAKEAVLFSRKDTDTWKTVEFGSHYRGVRQVPFFPNQCYLSVAGKNAATSPLVREAYDFMRGIVCLRKDEAVFVTEGDLRDIFGELSRFIAAVDTGVQDIHLDEYKVDEELRQLLPLVDLPGKPRFYHQGDVGAVIFELEEESEGTQRLYERLPLIFKTIKNGGVLVVDELENSWHSFIGELVIRLFNDPEVNPFGAQLIFSTHDISLMSSEHLRRDQIWFTEKKNGATTLFSLNDFDKKKVTPDSAFGKLYLEGRLGAFPKYSWAGVKELFKREVAHA